jgi:uncharacterized protein with ATP-grasp and redox domains
MLAELDLSEAPPLVAQSIHRRLREISGVDDPYRPAKDRFNRLAMEMYPKLAARVKSARHPFLMAVRLSIAGNVLDLSVNGEITEEQVREAVDQALLDPFSGDVAEFHRAAAEAANILYLADNAGEIVFDRLLIEQLGPARVTLVVRGSPVINDATPVDAQTVGLHKIVEVVDNGSDAPGTVLHDCSEEFRRRFREADLIIAKGQGNFETLSDEPGRLYFLFKVKCSAVASHLGLAVGYQVLKRSSSAMIGRESEPYGVRRSR